MRTKNTTDIPTEQLREIIRFVCPPGVTGFEVRLSNNTRAVFSGWAYHHGRCVSLKIGAAARFPDNQRYKHPGGYLPNPPFGTRTEALVYLAAHELRHLWQGNVPRGRRVWGARGQYSERDADAYALRMLRAWRRA